MGAECRFPNSAPVSERECALRRSVFTPVICDLCLALIGCGASTPEPAKAPVQSQEVCTGTLGVTLQTAGLTVGTQQVPLAIFRSNGRQFSQPEEPRIDVRVRFFRQLREGNMISVPGQEVRLMQPQATVRPSAVGPIVGPLMPSVRYNFVVDALFDQPGTWGAELFVSAPWQMAPAFSTILFHVAPTSPSAPPS